MKPAVKNPNISGLSQLFIFVFIVIEGNLKIPGIEKKSITKESYVICQKGQDHSIYFLMSLVSLETSQRNEHSAKR